MREIDRRQTMIGAVFSIEAISKAADGMAGATTANA
jgi:hypothetical protein